MSSLRSLAMTLGATVDGRWRPGIGDPTVFGWLTVGGYLIAFLLCWRVVAVERKLSTRGQGSRPVAFWCVLAAMLLLLGINKQLDLQTFFTQEARRLAKLYDWYDHKEALARWFIATLATGGIVLIGVLSWMCRRARRGTWLALVGTTFLVVFVTLRACSFHHVDRLLGLRLGAVNLNVTLELGGVALVALAAWVRLRHSRPPVSAQQPDKPARTDGLDSRS